MEAKELMIGDWVFYDPNVFIEDEYEPYREIYPTKIESGEEIDLAIENCYIPIPLTREILEKNGFKKSYHGTDYKSEFISIRMIVHIEPNGICYLYIEDKDITCTIEICIKYVHEFQHALRLCGINKEIEL